jgi:AraC family transcriptional regulator of adaptative response / DNA-3-methyladenine glycosylase II
MQAVLGQQVSLSAARTLATRLVTAKGDRIKIKDPSLSHLFPAAASIVDADLSKLGMPASRQATMRSLARAIATNIVTLDPGADRSEVRQRLLALPGIGEWTAGYIIMRALGDPDTFLSGDLGIRRAGERLGLGGNARVIADRASAWRPWRSYATHQLWATLADR